MLNLITQKTYPIPEDVDASSENEKIQKFLEKEEQRLAIKVNYQPISKEVYIFGFEEDVKQALSASGQFFGELRRKEISFDEHVRPDVSKFIETYFDDLKEVKEVIQTLRVSVKFEKQSSGILQFTITGLEENISLCRNILNKMISEIVSEDENVSYPGLKKFFEEKKGKDELATIERKWKVHITATPEESQNAIPKSGTFSSVYDCYNCTTDGGIIFSCKIGRIEHEKVSF